MISKINTWLDKKMCAPIISSWSFTSTISKEISTFLRLPRIFIGTWAVACYSCGWFYPVADRFSRAEYELRPILSHGQIKFRRLETICGCLESRRLDSSYDWVKFRRDASYGWLHPTTDFSSSGWIWVAADSILRLTLVLAAGYELRLIPFSGWL